MEIKSRGRWMASLLALGFLVMSTGLAQATLVDFQSLVQTESDLANSYTFDGSPLADTGGGGDNLNTRGTVTYGTGYGTSLAAEISAGNSLRSINHPFSAANTVEYIFKTDDKATGGHVMSGRVNSNRLYFGELFGSELTLKIGPNSNGQTLIGSADFNNDDWYYVAVSVEQIGADWVTNAWWANLSGGDTTLTQSVTANTVAATGLPGTSGNLGVGEFTFGASVFDGSIDDLNVYSASLSGVDLQGHLDAIVAVPEPSSFLMMGMTGLLFWGSSAGRRNRR